MADIETSIRSGNYYQVKSNTIMNSSIKKGNYYQVTTKMIMMPSLRPVNAKPNVSYMVIGTSAKDSYGSSNKLTEQDIFAMAQAIWNFRKKGIDVNDSIGKSLDNRTKLITTML